MVNDIWILFFVSNIFLDWTRNVCVCFFMHIFDLMEKIWVHLKLSNILCACIKAFCYAQKNGYYSWMAVTAAANDESTGREFNKLIQFGIQSTIEWTGDNGNFFNTHCLHTCSLPSTHVCWKWKKNKWKEEPQNCANIGYYSHSVLTFADMAGDNFQMYTRLSIMMMTTKTTTTTTTNTYRISYVVCKNAYYTTLALLKIVEWKKNIEWIFNRILGTPINICVCNSICVYVSKRISENGYE